MDASATELLQQAWPRDALRACRTSRFDSRRVVARGSSSCDDCCLTKMSRPSTSSGCCLPLAACCLLLAACRLLLAGCCDSKDYSFICVSYSRIYWVACSINQTDCSKGIGQIALLPQSSRCVKGCESGPKPSARGNMTIIFTWSRVSLRNVLAVGGSLRTSSIINA